MSATTKSDEPQPAAKAPEKFQFRIRDLLIATLLVALLLASIVQASLWLFLAWLAALTFSLVFVWKKTLLEVLVVLATIGVLIAMLLPARSGSGAAARRSQCGNNLQQIGVALHAYHDQYGCFPPAYVADKNGRPMHSWRVLILPFLEQKDIYDQYRFDEPWDGPNNRKLAQQIDGRELSFNSYRCSEDHDRQKSPETSYVAVIGPGTAWPGEESATLGDLTDGTPNVLMVVEAHHSGIHWMEPRDFHITQMAPGLNPARGQGISSRHGSGKAFGANVLYADGHVEYWRPDVGRAAIDSRLRVNDGTVKLAD
jgi:prepilin-type processing-associated H-X9-DG protein